MEFKEANDMPLDGTNNTLDEHKLNELLGLMVTELGAAPNAALVILGDELGHPLATVTHHRVTTVASVETGGITLVFTPATELHYRLAGVEPWNDRPMMEETIWRGDTAFLSALPQPK